MDLISKKTFETVDAYIAAQNATAQAFLEQIRTTVKKIAPQAKEMISYGIPAFKQEGMLIYYAAWAKHIGVYPIPNGDDAFMQDILEYREGKSTLKFLFNKPLPIAIIERFVTIKLEENIAKAEKKKNKKANS